MKLVVGAMAVALVVGILVGRTAERARRARNDLATARAAVTKFEKVLSSELRKTVLAAGAVVFILIALLSRALH